MQPRIAVVEGVLCCTMGYSALEKGRSVDGLTVLA
jgi:hypothetical protein